MELRHGYKQTEVGVIPNDWCVTSLRDLATLKVGYAFKSSWFSNGGDDFPLLRGENVGYGRPDWSDTKRISRHMAQSFSEYALTAGDVIIGMDRTFTKSGTKLSLMDTCDCPSLLVQRVGKFVPRKCGPRFLWALLSSARIQRALEVEQKGMDIPHLSRSDILLPLAAIPPTRQEQEAIAEALSDADALIESLEQLLAKKRHLKQGAMQELLTGRKRLPGFTGEWTVKSLGEVGEVLIGLTYRPRDVRTSGVLVLRSSNIFESALRFDDNVFVDTDIPQRIMARTGDILICVRNGSRDLIGKCAVLDERTRGMTFGAFMAVFRTPLHGFVSQQFQSDIIKRQIDEHLGATINQITNKSLNSFKIPMPTEVREQTAIAAVLSDMDADIAALEFKLAKTRALKQGMMQELLTGRIRLV